MKFLATLALLSCFQSPAKTDHLKLQGEVTAESVAPLVEALATAQGEVTIDIDSPGGSVYAGWDLVHAIEQSPAKVTCIVDGEADSMAAVVLQACDVRIMTERSALMMHEPSVGGGGQPDELARELTHLRIMSEQMARFCARRMGLTWRAYLAHVAHGAEWWLGPDEALKTHAVDRVIASPRKK